MQQLQPKQMHWVRADSSDFGGDRPAPRSGHTAVSIGKSKVVVFGGFADKRFLSDVSVYDVDNKLWYTPECTGNGSDGQAGPSPRSFHVAVVIDCNMFIFGGRSGGKRLGDFWMLDTDLWQWSEMTGFGDLPSPREFAAASAIGNRKIVMYGGWDGKKWLSDVYIMDTNDPIAKRDLAPNVDSARKPSTVAGDTQQSNLKGSQAAESPITELAKRLGISFSEEVSASFVDEINDKELVDLSSRLAGQSLPASDQVASIQLRMDDIPILLSEYGRLLST
nr:unnamed protein product [Digitaria exilis]